MSGSSRLRMLSACFALLIAGAFLIHVAAEDPANSHFRGVWERTDKPVADGLVGRTWQWGPQANTTALREPYAESPGGEREVQYYDKSRMEISQPGADATSIWYVTNGLLVVELMTGRLQLGDNTFEQHAAALVNVAGDGDDTLGPQYATLAGLRGAAPLADGVTITQTVDRSGAVGNDPAYASFGVTAAQRVTAPGIDHQIASPFWSFMNASGPVYANGVLTDALLFENAYFATGLPITEAYWAQIKVGGVVKSVLLQCFERRCLTYTPDNPAGWQVEQGNVGQHYYQWRYDDGGPGGEPTATATSTPTATATASEEPTDPPVTDYIYAGHFGLRSDPAHNMSDPYDVAFTSDGAYFYVVDTIACRIQKFTSLGVFVTQWGVPGSGDGQLSFPYAATVDASGNVYVVDRNNHRIQKFDENGQFLKKWGTMGSLAGEFLYPTDIVIDSAGNIYVLDGDNHRVQKYTSEEQWVSAFGSYGTADGQLNYPHGIDIDAEGRFYIGDTFNERVQVFSAEGTFLRKWGTEGAATGQFNWPSSVLLDETETLLYVSDTTNDRIQVFDTNGVHQRTIGSTGTAAGQLDYPRGLAFNASGLLYVADADNGRVQVFEPQGGGPLIQVRGDQRGRFLNPTGIDISAEGQFATVDDELNQVQLWDGPELPIYDWGHAELLAPRDLAFDSLGDLYVTDSGHNRVVKYSDTGQKLAEWGAAGSGDGQFNSPQGIALDGDGNVYVVDQGNHRIQKFTATGTFIKAWGSQGSGEGQLGEPQGIAVWGDSVYVTEKANHRVQEFDLDGAYIRHWGSAGIGDGQFDLPYGIAVDELGYLYVTDSGNDRIQKFTPTGEYVVEFGAAGTANGQFQTPLGIAVGPTGDVLVTDAGNARIQVFSTPQ